MTEPSFESWVSYCFTKGMPDFKSPAGNLDSYLCLSGVAYGWRETAHIPVQLVAAYLSRLFRSPEFVADQFSDAQIAEGLWFIFGDASAYQPAIRASGVSEALRRELIASLEPFYARLLDKLSCQRGSDPRGDYVDIHEVDTAVFMIGHELRVDPLGADAGLLPVHSRMLRPLAFDVLASILVRSVTSTCQMSALHALGHLRNSYPRFCKPIIRDFLRRRDIALCARQYGEYAKQGGIV